jgi:fluoride ion exporter CrcB/FEX
MPVFVAVAFAGAIGAAARYGLDVRFSRDANHIPWVTSRPGCSQSRLA